MSKEVLVKYIVVREYTDFSGNVIPAGSYTTKEINLDEAKALSIVYPATNKSIPEQLKKEEYSNKDETLYFGNVSPLLSFGKLTKVEKIEKEANTITKDVLLTFKGVSEEIANKFLAERANGDYKDYEDLNRRVPMKGRTTDWRYLVLFNFKLTIQTTELPLTVQQCI